MAAKLPKPLSKGEETLMQHIKAHKLPEPEREYRFYPDRKWRFDFAWPKARLAVEVEGGLGMGGRHQTYTGFTNDCIKYNHAAREGWCVLRFTPAQVKSGYAMLQIEPELKLRLDNAAQIDELLEETRELKAAMAAAGEVH